MKEEERRYLPRWEVNNRVFYRADPEANFQECQSRDLHFSGACLCTNQSLPLNQKLKLRIFLSDQIAVDVEGTVLWNKSVGQQNFVGINFYEISQKVQEKMLKYAFEVKKADMVRHWFRGWGAE